MAEIGHDGQIRDFLMPGIEGIALLFQRILLAAALLLTVGQLIGGRHLPQTQTVIEKVKVQRRLLVDPVAVAVHQLRQLPDIGEVVEHAVALFALQLGQLNGLVLQIKPVEVHPILLFLLEFLTVFKESPNRENHTGPRHGYRRKDIDPPRLHQRDQHRHPDHEQGRHDQSQELITGLGRFLTGRSDPNLLLRTPVDDPRRAVVVRIIRIKTVAGSRPQSQLRPDSRRPGHPDFLRKDLEADRSKAQLIPRLQQHFPL
ncbi:hypothetical protein STRDD11_00576 [Streptococcus sp. DD11]|nr:hypothetical protein STRDD11_00576 [Streptococcus sp. DD11]